MRRELEIVLQRAFDAPAPPGKAKFLEKYGSDRNAARAWAKQKFSDQKKFNPGSMILTQIRYIRKWVWAVSFFVFLAAVAGLYQSGSKVIPVIAVLMPFVSGAAVLESVRSKAYGMDELEAVTLFSLRGILFARFTVIGSSHLILLVGLMILLGSRSDWGYLLTGAVITLPYLLSSVISMEAERRTSGRNQTYVCMAVSAVVAVFVAAAEYSDLAQPLLEGDRAVWIFSLLALFVLNLLEYRRWCMEAQPQNAG